MLSLILTIIITAVGLFFIYKSWKDKRKDDVVFLLITMTVLNVSTILASKSIAPIVDYEKQSEYVSLKTGTTSDGGFLLGSGTIEGLEYIFAMSFDGKYYRKEKIKATNLLIEEVDYLKDKAELFYAVKEHEIWGRRVDCRHKLIKIPKNTVIKNIQIN